MADSHATAEQKAAFATALNAAHAARGMGPSDLIPVTGSAKRSAGQSTAQKWTKGVSEPLRPKVTEIERLLELEPGTLSRHLGWLPVNAPAVPDVEAAILADSRFSEDQKVLLLGLVSQMLRGEGRQD